MLGSNFVGDDCRLEVGELGRGVEGLWICVEGGFFVSNGGGCDEVGLVVIGIIDWWSEGDFCSILGCVLGSVCSLVGVWFGVIGWELVVE